MRLLADENIPLPVIRGLREDGHDVVWIGTDHSGIDDRVVLRRTHDEERVLMTFDKDFGTLIFREQAGPPMGILLFRPPDLSKSEQIAQHTVVGTSLPV